MIASTSFEFYQFFLDNYEQSCRRYQPPMMECTIQLTNWLLCQFLFSSNFKFSTVRTQQRENTQIVLFSSWKHCRRSTIFFLKRKINLVSVSEMFHFSLCSLYFYSRFMRSAYEQLLYSVWLVRFYPILHFSFKHSLTPMLYDLCMTVIFLIVPFTRFLFLIRRIM